MEQEVSTPVEVEQVVQPQQPAQDESASILSNLKLSEEAAKQLQGNEELLKVITHNLEAKRNANQEAKTYREQLENLQAQQKAAEEERLKKKGEYESLYNNTLEELTTERNKVNQAVIGGKLEALAARKGLRKSQYLKMFDTSGLVVDENLNVPDLEAKFEVFFNENPDLFGTVQPNVPNVPTSKPVISQPTVQETFQKLKSEAAKGDRRAIARYMEFKKTNGIK